MGVAVGGSDVEHDPVRADGIRGELGAIEDEVRPQPEQGPVLGAERLTLGAIGEDDRPAAGLTGDRSPLPADREAGPAATEQAARLEDRDHSGGRGSGRRPPETGEMGGKGFRPRSGGRTGEDARLHQWFLQAGSTATGSAVPPVTAARRLRLVPPAVRRQTSAALTARMLAPCTASIQRANESLPAVSVCSTASGQAAYEAQWMARHVRCPIRSRRRLVRIKAAVR